MPLENVTAVLYALRTKKIKINTSFIGLSFGSINLLDLNKHRCCSAG